METTDSSVKSTTIVGADARFATTFLSTKYRDKAVAGEALMDKNTGELYIKRVTDGKIVSFYQNKKKINDLALDLRVLLLNNKTFIYPSENEEAFYVSTNYDLITINNESLHNLITDNIIIEDGPDDINKLSFKLSSKTNGFFCRGCTRDIEKPFVEYLTSEYNEIIKNYTGDDEEYLNEKSKFNTNVKWEDSNATITYDVTISKNETKYSYTGLVDYINLNNTSTIILPDIIFSEVDSFDFATITIKSITFDKFHFIYNHIDELNEVTRDNLYKLISLDNRVEICEFNISHFVNNATDILMRGNESIIAFLTVKHINDYMKQMQKLVVPSNPPVEVSSIKPVYECLWFKPY